MRARSAARLAWSVWAASVVLLACAVALQTASRHAPRA